MSCGLNNRTIYLWAITDFNTVTLHLHSVSLTFFCDCLPLHLNNWTYLNQCSPGWHWLIPKLCDGLHKKGCEGHRLPAGRRLLTAAVCNVAPSYCSQQSLLVSSSDEMHAVRKIGLFIVCVRTRHNIGYNPLLSRVSDAVHSELYS
jgi:hypothetical protein